VIYTCCIIHFILAYFGLAASSLLIMLIKGLTPEARKKNILNVTSKFSPYLLSPPPPGSVLNCLERLAVAYIAREAITFVDGLPDDVCTRPNFNFYNWMKNSKISFSFPKASNTSEEKQGLLVKTVHAIIRHQHRIDKDWYKNTLQEIQSIFLRSGKSEETEEATKVRCHQIFCELMCIAITSSSIQMYFMTLDEKVLDLPTFEEGEKVSKSHPVAKDLNMMSLLNQVHWDPESVSEFSPHYTTKDVNKESPEFKEMGKALTPLFLKAVGHGPRLCFGFAPYDNVTMMEVVKTLYIADKEMLNFRSFDNKCNGVTRFQLESIAAGYTGAVNCDF